MNNPIMAFLREITDASQPAAVYIPPAAVKRPLGVTGVALGVFVGIMGAALVGAILIAIATSH